MFTIIVVISNGYVICNQLIMNNSANRSLKSCKYCHHIILVKGMQDTVLYIHTHNYPYTCPFINTYTA